MQDFMFQVGLCWWLQPFTPCSLILIQSPVVRNNLYEEVVQGHCCLYITQNRLNVTPGLKEIITGLWTWVLIPCKPPFPNSCFSLSPQPVGRNVKSQGTWRYLLLHLLQALVFRASEDSHCILLFEDTQRWGGFYMRKNCIFHVENMNKKPFPKFSLSLLSL